MRIILFLLSMIFASSLFATTLSDTPNAKKFIAHMVLQHHFQEKELIKLLNAVKIRHAVVSHVKHPKERQSWGTYRAQFVTDKHIARGILFYQKYESTLKRAEKIYQVPASIIVATIGIESNYGQVKGKFAVIEALATLAFGNGPRKTFFVKELEEFLLLTREEHLNPLTVMGSYAGAIGQPQFMPSSYRKYAINFSGKTPLDLYHNEEDVIGSIANYYHKNGWNYRELITIPVSLANGKYQTSYLSPRPISTNELLSEGILKNIQLNKLPKHRVLKLENFYESEYWLSFENFEVIKRYNYSDLYAMAVYQLSYYIDHPAHLKS